MDALVKYAWPGNVRELKNIMERMVVLSNSATLELRHIPEDIRQSSPVLVGQPAMAPGADSPMQSLSDIERETIRQTLARVRGNKSLAAKRTGED